MGYEALCPSCEEDLKKSFSPTEFLSDGGNGFADAMTALFPYDSYCAKKLIHLWKREDLPLLSALFRPFFRAWYHKKGKQGFDFVTFIPRSREERRKFGFDHAEKIAKALSEEISVPFEEILLRQGHSKKQHYLSKEKRRENVAGAFACPKALRGETVLLVDDIVTSGASAKECARVLKKAGAQKVFVLSVLH